MSSYMSEAEVNARVIAEGPAEPTPAVFIVGAGVVGTALAARLVRAGIPVIGLHGRQAGLRRGESDLRRRREHR
jgi:3-hydroxyacyl-CoA dehydrogenase